MKTEQQLKINNLSPLALLVARAMPRPHRLSGRGCTDYHLPSVLNHKIRFVNREVS